MNLVHLELKSYFVKSFIGKKVSKLSLKLSRCRKHIFQVSVRTSAKSATSVVEFSFSDILFLCSFILERLTVR